MNPIPGLKIHSGEWNETNVITSAVIGITAAAGLAFSSLIAIHAHSTIAHIWSFNKIPVLYSYIGMGACGTFFIGDMGFVFHRLKKMKQFYAELPVNKIKEKIEEMRASRLTNGNLLPLPYGLVIDSKGVTHLFGKKASNLIKTTR